VPAAIEFQAEHEWPRVQAECHELLRQVRQRLEHVFSGATHLGGAMRLQAIHPDSPEWYAQMAALPLPPCDAEILQRRLRDEFSIEVPIIDWNGRQFVRVSIQAYNATEDVDALREGLRKLLA
jgi:isopenicillin-N epimerase